jgi:hypothetical protein
MLQQRMSPAKVSSPMPVLSNARHERFARALADGATLDEALLIAGYKAGSHIAARLCARGDVVQRVRELRGEPFAVPPRQPSDALSGIEVPGTRPGMTDRGGLAPDCESGAQTGLPITDLPRPPAPTRQWVLARLVDNVERALQLGEAGGGETARGKYDGSVANRALELLGKELGMFTERSDNQHTPHDISDQPLTPEEWAKRHGVDR